MKIQLELTFDELVELRMLVESLSYLPLEPDQESTEDRRRRELCLKIAPQLRRKSDV